MAIDAAHGFLEEAVSTLKARAQLRDAQGGERSMARTVDIFNAWTGNKLSENDGWRFMIALKQAREVQGKYNRDDYVDLSAYCSLLGEYESGHRPAGNATNMPTIDFSAMIKDTPGGIPAHIPNRITAADLLKSGAKPFRGDHGGIPYSMQSSALAQVDTFDKDALVGVPFGAISLGEALNEE